MSRLCGIALSILLSFTSVYAQSVATRDVTTNVADSGTNGDIFFTSPSPYTTSGIVMQSKTTWPSITAKLGDSGSSSFTIFSAAGDDLLRVRGDGKVGINVPVPTYQLHVINASPASGAVYGLSNTTVTVNGTQIDYGGQLYGYQDVYAGVTNSGSVTGLRARGYLTGLGTVTNVYGVYAEAGLPSSATGGTIIAAYALRAKVGKGGGTITTGYGLFIDDVEATNAYGVYQRHETDKNYFAGYVGIGVTNPTRELEVDGDAHFTGTVTGGIIQANYQDVAEWVPSTDDLAPGTVVVLSTRNANEVTASSDAYDSRVAGVVSAQPGVLLGQGGEGKEQIATTGRVRVRVDARRRPVRIGDLLVTSDVEGAAMVSEPLALNGRAIHQPGTILGKALENLDGGIGEVLVLLSLQ